MLSVMAKLGWKRPGLIVRPNPHHRTARQRTPVLPSYSLGETTPHLKRKKQSTERTRGAPPYFEAIGSTSQSAPSAQRTGTAPRWPPGGLRLHQQRQKPRAMRQAGGSSTAETRARRHQGLQQGRRRTEADSAGDRTLSKLCLHEVPQVDADEVGGPRT